MLEIYKNGPVVVSLEPDYDFMFYKKGIYHKINFSNWLLKGEKKPEWVKVTHSGNFL
jgi:cathepsin C